MFFLHLHTCFYSEKALSLTARGVKSFRKVRNFLILNHFFCELCVIFAVNNTLRSGIILKFCCKTTLPLLRKYYKITKKMLPLFFANASSLNCNIYQTFFLKNLLSFG